MTRAGLRALRERIEDCYGFRYVWVLPRWPVRRRMRLAADGTPVWWSWPKPCKRGQKRRGR